MRLQLISYCMFLFDIFRGSSVASVTLKEFETSERRRNRAAVSERTCDAPAAATADACAAIDGLQLCQPAPDVSLLQSVNYDDLALTDEASTNYYNVHDATNHMEMIGYHSRDEASGSSQEFEDVPAIGIDTLDADPFIFALNSQQRLRMPQVGDVPLTSCPYRNIDNTHEYFEADRSYVNGFLSHSNNFESLEEANVSSLRMTNGTEQKRIDLKSRVASSQEIINNHDIFVNTAKDGLTHSSDSYSYGENFSNNALSLKTCITKSGAIQSDGGAQANLQHDNSGHTNSIGYLGASHDSSRTCTNKKSNHRGGRGNKSQYHSRADGVAACGPNKTSNTGTNRRGNNGNRRAYTDTGRTGNCSRSGKKESSSQDSWGSRSSAPAAILKPVDFSDTNEFPVLGANRKQVR